MSTPPLDPQTALNSVLEALAAEGDHFTVLQVARTATPADVRDAYFRLAKVVHPDLPVFLINPKLRADATRAFQAITIAHAMLSDVNKRAAYVQSLESAKTAKLVEAMTAPVPQTTSPSGRMQAQITPETAKVYLARGRLAVQRRDWQVAQDALNLACRGLTDSELREAKMNYGWAIFNNTANAEADRINRPRDLWMEVVDSKERSPAVAQAHYYLAVWNKMHGDMREASKHVEACLAQDPRHIDAQREKLLLERRKTGAAASSTGRFEAVGDRRTSRTNSPAGGSAPTKVPLKKEPSFFEKLFGPKKS
ncbi:MAG: J domain-containing protein [Deltaproteobacteria bacterium]|nr:J domain-containing protein [Deltaproteobacteria bacterium]